MVKDIVICGGAESPALSFINKLEKDTYSLVGVDRGAYRLVEAGYLLDYAIGDFDSVDESELDLIRENTAYFEINPDQNYTDMELALDLAIKVKSDWENIYIIGGLGSGKGRLDHLLANLGLVYEERYEKIYHRITFVENKQVVKFFPPASQRIQELAKTSYLSVFLMTPVENLTIRGGRYNLSKTSFKHPKALISNEFVGGDIELDFSSGIVMVIWYLEEDIWKI